MRSLIAALPLLALTACGGASGPQTVGSVAPPTGGGTGGTGGTGGSGGTGGGIGGGTGGTQTPTPTPSNLLDVSAETSFNATGSFHSLDVTESGIPNLSGPVLYQGNASTVRAPSGTVSYNPRDGIFTVQFTDNKAGMATGPVRFQDPAHRTNYGGSASPSWGTPEIDGFNYLEAVGPTSRGPSSTDPNDFGRTDTVTFFYQRPGTQTKYVSLAGYVRNAFERTADPLVFKSPTVSNFQRGAMVFGTETVRSEVPISGTGRYTGGMLATMVVNTTLDTDRVMPNYFQWITGSSEINLDFGASTMSMILTGKAHAATYAGVILAPNQTGVPEGSDFRAVGSGSINLTSTGGFIGKFSSVTFSNTLNGQTIPIYEGVNPGNSNAGANSIDGTFFGPGAVNVGGNFRIVGGVPDQRVDILGAFTGAKQ